MLGVRKRGWGKRERGGGENGRGLERDIDLRQVREKTEGGGGRDGDWRGREKTVGMARED